eukprot:scaffold10476_cov142-Cylindrotheca_fusiformis.AAC.11
MNWRARAHPILGLLSSVVFQPRFSSFIATVQAVPAGLKSGEVTGIPTNYKTLASKHCKPGTSMPPAAGQAEPIKRMLKILNSLWNRSDSAPFREPVDWRGLELYDYPEIISKMMDLGTIKRRLERNHYTTAHQVAEDIRLVWDNCMTYNADGSDFWLLAKSYSRRFEDRYRKVKQEFDVGEDLFDGSHSDEETSKPSSSTTSKGKSSSAKESSALAVDSSGSPSLDARARFGANIFLLSGVELGHVVTTLELKCPKVLEQGYEDHVEINVDEIPPNVFSNLNSYVSSKIGNRSLLDSNRLDVLDERIPKKKKRKTI